MLRAPTAESSLLGEVSVATGLAPMIAAGVLERCCRRAGVSRATITRRDLQKLLPHLEPALLVYQTGREVMAALERLQQLADGTGRRSLPESFIRTRDGAAAPRRFSSG